MVAREYHVQNVNYTNRYEGTIMKKACNMLLALVIMGLTVCSTQAHQRIATQFIMGDDGVSAIATIKVPLKINKAKPTNVDICFDRKHSSSIPVIELVLTFVIDFEQNTLELINQSECFDQFIKKLEVHIGRPLTRKEFDQLTQHIEERAAEILLPTIEKHTDYQALEHRNLIHAINDVPVQLFRLGRSIVIIFWHAGKFVVKCIRQYGPGVWESLCKYTVATKESAMEMADTIREKLSEDRVVAD